MSVFADPRRRVIAVLLGAVVVAAVLIAASRLSTDESQPEPVATATPAVSPFTGIPQSGIALGREDAPVTLIEYADIQCPFCAQWATRTMPVLVDEYVRAGELRIVFHGLAFLGPDSVKALDATIAAGEHDRLFEVLDTLFRNQGEENAGWVTDDLLDEAARSAGLEPEDLRASSPWVERTKVEADTAAKYAGITGTPAFQVGRTGGEMQVVRVDSLEPEELRPAIDALLRE